ncbi:MAG: hypothetical protein JWP36_2539 [Paucimonas sp.]|nr:hypothetical protein [Paucimonas sp.]
MAGQSWRQQTDPTWPRSIATRSVVFPTRPWLLLASLTLAGSLLAGAARSQPAPPAAPAATPVTPAAAANGASKPTSLSAANLVLLELRMDGYRLSDSITAYQAGQLVYLPLGEVARALTIAIQVDPAAGTAGGFVRRENSGFALNVGTATLELSGQRQVLDRPAIVLQDDDIYVETRALSQWLRIDFDISLSALVIDAKPIEPLPLQLRLAREGKAATIGQAGQAPARLDLPRLEPAYRLAGIPFIDQTISVGTRRGNGAHENSASYTTYMKGDLAGMQGALYTTGSNQEGTSQTRLTLGRSDPEGGLLGPLNARNFGIGNVPVAGILNLSRTSDTGRGITVNNLPLDRPARFNTHTLQGDLPPGWDVELYFNDALVAYQQSRPDGRYRFDDQPLIFGSNEFRLVFHGPQGQLRVERQNFMLDESMTVPGSFFYNLASARDSAGLRHSVALAEWGLSDRVTLAGSSVNDQRADGTTGRYHSLGLRAFAALGLFTGNLTRQAEGGLLTDLGFKTRFGRTALSYNRLLASRDFSSDFFPTATDPVRSRDRLRLDGQLPGNFIGVMPYTVQVQRDRTASGANITDSTAMVSATYKAVSLSNQLHLVTAPGTRSMDGTFSTGSNFGAFRLRGQLNYLLRPEYRLAALAATTDRTLSGGYLVSLSAQRDFMNLDTRFNLALNKSLGHFAMALTGGYSVHGEFSIGLVFFTGVARDPRSSKWSVSALPRADTGAASALAYLDRNANGIFDSGDEALKGVGFTLNGSGLPGRTGEDGTASVERLPAYRFADLAINPSTLEDPQMSPRSKGYRLLPRPGNTALLDFPVTYTGDVDGTVFLLRSDKRRGAGNVLVQLVDERQQVVAEARSGSDGFYTIQDVPPGRYSLRVAPAQVEQLKLKASTPQALSMSASGDPVTGRDFVLERAEPPSK